MIYYGQIHKVQMRSLNEARLDPWDDTFNNIQRRHILLSQYSCTLDMLYVTVCIYSIARGSVCVFVCLGVNGVLSMSHAGWWAYRGQQGEGDCVYDTAQEEVLVP